METSCNFISLISSFFLIAFSSASIIQTSTLLGVRPQEEKYFASEVIKCRDGSKSFTRDRLNDGFCDCVDGTDEPGTSACPEGKFYCINVGSTPLLLFSSRVNDHFCDCCDGSDEYDGAIQCPNTCYKDEKVVAEDGIYNLTTNLVGIGMHETKRRANLEDLIQKLKGLKIVIAVEVVLVSCVMGLMVSRLFRWHFKSRQRRLAEKYTRLHNKSSL